LVVQSGVKNIRFTFLKIRIIRMTVSRPPEGRIAIVTTRGARDAMDAAVSTANGSAAYSEVVWSWRRDAGAKLLRSKLLRGDGDKKARSPGRARYRP
jgi:hypothetical protein